MQTCARKYNKKQTINDAIHGNNKTETIRYQDFKIKITKKGTVTMNFKKAVLLQQL